VTRGVCQMRTLQVMDPLRTPSRRRFAN